MKSFPGYNLVFISGINQKFEYAIEKISDSVVPIQLETNEHCLIKEISEIQEVRTFYGYYLMANYINLRVTGSLSEWLVRWAKDRKNIYLFGIYT